MQPFKTINRDRYTQIFVEQSISKQLSNTYTPLFDTFYEGFQSGAHVKVMKLLSSLLKKRTSVNFDLDIPEGYQNNLGKFRSYTGYFSGKEIRINFLLSNSDYIYSADLRNDNDVTKTTIVFDKGLNVIQILDSLTALIKGEIDKFEESFGIDEKRRASKKGDVVVSWITDPEFKDRREKDIQKMMLSKLYTDFVRTVSRDVKVPSQATFRNVIKQYLKDNGMSNPHLRPKFKKIKAVKVEIPVILPEEKSKISDFKEPTKLMFTWREAFEDLEDNFNELMADKKMMPFGQLVYGPGGTGKSFYFLQQKSKHDMIVIKGAPNIKRLIRILYDYRNVDVIIFDDADSVVTNANSANILKGATDDTVSIRKIFLPAVSGELGDLELDFPDEQAFSFNASIVIITNLKDIKDKALRTRLYLNPIFMTKQDIIEKIEATSKPEDFGCSKQQGSDVAEFMISLVNSGQFVIKDEQLSYRFFKIGLKMIKNYPGRWKGKVMRNLGIGIRTSL